MATEDDVVVKVLERRVRTECNVTVLAVTYHLILQLCRVVFICATNKNLRDDPPANASAALRAPCRSQSTFCPAADVAIARPRGV